MRELSQVFGLLTFRWAWRFSQTGLLIAWGAVVFVADDLAAWLIGLLADAGRRRLIVWVLGANQERALRQASSAAVHRTTAELWPDDAVRAERLAMVIDQVFSGPPQGALDGSATLLEGLQAEISGQMALLDDAELTGAGRSAADVLGIRTVVLDEKLAENLIREIVIQGARGGPLEPLAAQLNHDLTHLQGQRLEALFGQLAGSVREVLSRLDSSQALTSGRAATIRQVAVGDIPQQPPGYQERAGLLAVLDAAGPQVSIVHAVMGMRGVGKSQLAAAYARAKLVAGWDVVAWVNAGDSSSLVGGLAALAEAIGLVGQGRGDPGTMVRHWLETSGGRYLLVFDNATDTDSLRPYLPAVGTAQVVVTSNRHSVANLGKPVRVEVFTDREAVAFLTARTGLGDVAGAETVAAELGALPLALAQAAAVITGQRLSYGTYLQRLRELPVAEYLAREPGQAYPHGVAEAVLLSLAAVQAGDQGSTCTRVLEMMSVLSPAGVRRSLVHAAGRAGTLHGEDQIGVSEAVADGALGRLAEWSLLSFTLDGQSVSAHRLVLRVVRERLAQQGRLAAVWRAAALVVDAHARILTGTLDRPAVREVSDQVAALQQAAVALPSETDELEATLLGLRLWALYHLNELGDSTEQAILIGEPLLADLERVVGPDHPDTLTTQNNLATAYRVVGRTAEAISLQEQALATSERVLGSDHPDTLARRGNLASAYQAAGRTAEAVTLNEQIVASSERMLEPDDPDLLVMRNNLATAYQAAGRVAEAIALHEQVVASRRQVLGLDHPHTLISQGNLAAAYRDAGRVAEAIALHEQVIALREQVLGPEHPSTLRSRANLALAYRDAGRTAEAVTLNEEVLADMERVLGPDHPFTAQARNNLATARRMAG